MQERIDRDVDVSVFQIETHVCDVVIIRSTNSDSVAERTRVMTVRIQVSVLLIQEQNEEAVMNIHTIPKQVRVSEIL